MVDPTLLAIAQKAFQAALAFTFNFLCRTVAQSIEDGDISLVMLKDMLQTRVDQVQSIVNTALRGSLGLAYSNVELALINLGKKKAVAAGRHFEFAEQSALSAFHYAQTFEDKMAATRLRILCTFHTCGYFNRCNGNYDSGYLLAILRDGFTQLILTNEVQSALRDAAEDLRGFRYALDYCTGSRQLPLRVNILSTVFALRSQLLLATETTTTEFDVMSTRTSQVYGSLHHPSMIVHNGFYLSKISKLYAHADTLFATDTFNNVIVWDTRSMTIVATKKFQGMVDSMFICNEQLFVATQGPSARLAVWSATKYTYIDTIAEGKVQFLTQAKDKLYGAIGRDVHSWDVNSLNVVFSIASDLPITALYANANSLCLG